MANFLRMKKPGPQFCAILSFWFFTICLVSATTPPNHIQRSESLPEILNLPAGYKTPLEKEYSARFIQVRNNVWLNVIDINPSKNKALIFVHGDAGSFDYWLPQINFFKSRYRIIVYEREDCGKSITKNFQPAYSNSAEDIALMVRKLGIHPHVIIGHSRGQEIAAVYYSINPPELAGFVAEGTGICISPSSQTVKEALKEISRHRAGKIDLRLSCFNGLQKYKELFAKGMALPDDRITELMKYSCANWKPAPGIMGGTDIDISNKLKLISIPMLQIDGANYRKDRDRRQTMQKYYKNGRLHLVQNSGHVPHLEDSSEFNRLLSDFLKQIGF